MEFDRLLKTRIYCLNRRGYILGFDEETTVTVDELKSIVLSTPNCPRCGCCISLKYEPSCYYQFAISSINTMLPPTPDNIIIYCRHCGTSRNKSYDPSPKPICPNCPPDKHIHDNGHMAIFYFSPGRIATLDCSHWL
jgi:hypothetical protein